MQGKRKINICRPGYNASCALCCGSHNYDISAFDCDALFKERRSLMRDWQESDSPVNASIYLPTQPALFTDAIQCGYVGYCDEKNSEIGCLIYNSEHYPDAETEELFTRTCRYFQCPAWKELTDTEILFAARLFRDWFYYSLFINDVPLLQNFYTLYLDKGPLTQEEKRAIQNELENKLWNSGE